MTFREDGDYGDDDDDEEFLDNDADYAVTAGNDVHAPVIVTGEVAP